MRKSKSVFVTVVMAAMLAAIIFGLYQMKIPAFKYIISVLALYGFLDGSAGFCRWLGRETPLLPAKPQREPEEFHIDEETFDDIIAEMRGDTVGADPGCSLDS